MRELLLSYNIETEVRGEGMFGLQGELPMDDSTLPYLWLLTPHQHTQAKTIIAEFEQLHQQIASQKWRCIECDEINEGQFALCWQCGSNRPED
ncbi:DUF2007 domain-containing protein [Vibrio rarus]